MTARWSKWPTFRRRNVARLLEDTVAASATPRSGSMRPSSTSSSTPTPVASTESRPKSINGKRLKVTADWFVFAAGTFETTRLLLQLDALTEGRAFSGCEALGRYFIDHLKIEAGPHQAGRQQANQSRLRLSHRRHDPPRPPPGNHRRRSARRSSGERLRYGSRRVSAALDPSLCAQSGKIGSGAAVPRACAKARDGEGSAQSGPSPLLEGSAQADVLQPSHRPFRRCEDRASAERMFTPYAFQEARRAWRGDVADGLAEDARSTSTPFARFCCARGGFGDRLFSTRRALSIGRSIRIRTI